MHIICCSKLTGRFIPGEHWLIFGLNGCGKTTLLSTVAGFKPITSGKLSVLGQEYDAENIFELRKKVGWVSSSFFDHYFSKESAMHIVLSGLFGSLNVEFGVRDRDVRFAKELLKELHMEDKLKRPFYTMSKGERQNILLARALISHPEILVLDEPGTGLDLDAREHMMETVRLLAEDGGVTVLYVTHYPEEIQSFMTKTMLLQNGRIFAQGATNELLKDDIISEFFQKPAKVLRQQDGRIKISIKESSNILQVYQSKMFV